MITRLQVKNYRCLRNVDIQFDNLTVLVGRNGAGKSTVVDVLRFLRDSLESGIDNALIERGGIKTLRRWSRSSPYQIEIVATVEEENFWGRYTLKLAGTPKSFKIVLEKGEIGTKAGNVEKSFERGPTSWTKQPNDGRGDLPMRFTTRALEPTVLALPVLRYASEYNRLYFGLRGQFYTIFPNTLRLPQKAGNERVLVEDGSNFGAILRDIAKDKRRRAELIAALGRVVEGVNGLKVEAAGSYLVTYLEHQDLSSSDVPLTSAKKSKSSSIAPWFDLAQESDGTLRLLGMLVALHQNQPTVFGADLLALEEPEIALHPGALPVLRDAILEASERQQILITTQSADLIDGFDVDNLRVVERVGGVSKVGHVDSNQREVVKSKLFTAGELIRTEGRLHLDKAHTEVDLEHQLLLPSGEEVATGG